MHGVLTYLQVYLHMILKNIKKKLKKYLRYRDNSYDFNGPTFGYFISYHFILITYFTKYEVLVYFIFNLNLFINDFVFLLNKVRDISVTNN